MTMATMTENITCGNCVFYHQFDSANLAKVEQVKITDPPEKGTVILCIKTSILYLNFWTILVLFLRSSRYGWEIFGEYQ